MVNISPRSAHCNGIGWFFRLQDPKLDGMFLAFIGSLREPISSYNHLDGISNQRKERHGPYSEMP